MSPDVQISAEGYNSGHLAPGYEKPMLNGIIDYVVMHNKLKSIATVYKMYNEEFRSKQQGILINLCDVLAFLINLYFYNFYSLNIGQISLVIDGTWFYPQDPNNLEHQKSAEFALLSTVNTFNKLNFIYSMLFDFLLVIQSIF